MSRYARDKRPRVKPVKKIRLSEEHLGRRVVAAAIVLVIGGFALAYAVMQMMTPDTGWQTIEANGSAGATCADELVFLYELGAGEIPAPTENRAVRALYSDTCRKLFQLFHTVESFEGMTNLRDINLHPNETLTVDQTLYRAFETVQRFGDRTVYLGPVYARYNDLFFCTDDFLAGDFDPWLSDEVREEYGAYAAFARDPQAVDVRLLGDGQLRLEVSEEYLAFAQREGIERFLDFGWLKNAFVVDCLAETLIEGGYTHGSISSYDGFSRSLDDRELSYSQNLFDLVDGVAYPAGVMRYEGPLSIVCLRDYPVDGMDSRRFYRTESGEIHTSYLDPADGLCRSAAHDLTCYSKAAGCAEIALQAAPIYVADGLEAPALEALADGGIHSIRCEGRVVRGTDSELTVANLYEQDGVRYTVEIG